MYARLGSFASLQVTLVILDGLTNILATGQKIGQIDQVCNQVEECGGLDKIEMLQQSENEKVYQVALDIIEVSSKGNHGVVTVLLI